MPVLLYSLNMKHETKLAITFLLAATFFFSWLIDLTEEQQCCAKKSEGSLKDGHSDKKLKVDCKMKKCSEDLLSSLKNSDDASKEKFGDLMEQVAEVDKANRAMLSKLSKLDKADKVLLQKNACLNAARKKEAAAALAARQKLLQEKDIQLEVERKKQQICHDQLLAKQDKLQRKLVKAQANEKILREAVIAERMELMKLSKKSSSDRASKEKDEELLLKSLKDKEAEINHLQTRSKDLENQLEALRLKSANQKKEKEKLVVQEMAQADERKKLMSEIRGLTKLSDKLKSDLDCQKAQSCAVTAVAKNLEKENAMLKNNAEKCRNNWKLSEMKQELVQEKVNAPFTKQKLDSEVKKLECFQRKYDKYQALANQFSKEYVDRFKSSLDCPSTKEQADTDNIVKKVIDLVAHRIPQEVCETKMADDKTRKVLLSVYKKNCGS